MKKLLALIMVMVLCLSLCACGGKSKTNVKATVINNDGVTEKLSSKELCDIYSENEARYRSKYQSADVTITGTVKTVESHLESYGTTTHSVYDIILEEGWEITVLEEFHEEVINLSAGDKVTISSELELVFGELVHMENIGVFGSEWYDKTIIEIN